MSNQRFTSERDFFSSATFMPLQGKLWIIVKDVVWFNPCWTVFDLSFDPKVLEVPNIFFKKSGFFWWNELKIYLERVDGIFIFIVNFLLTLIAPLTESFSETYFEQCQVTRNESKGRISKRVFRENTSRQIFRKTNICCPLIHTCTCAYQMVRHVSFSENLICFVFLKHPTGF